MGSALVLHEDSELVVDNFNVPAWEDSDDERLTISLASYGQRRKLRDTEIDDVVSGTEYSRRLRRQYEPPFLLICSVGLRSQLAGSSVYILSQTGLFHRKKNPSGNAEDGTRTLAQNLQAQKWIWMKIRSLRHHFPYSFKATRAGPGPMIGNQAPNCAPRFLILPG